MRHCLEPDPSRRYQTARELQEDLRRQLDDLPLRHAPEPSARERLGKWARRHPRLTSSTTVGLVSVVLLLSLSSAFFLRSRHYRRVEASSALHWLGRRRRQVIASLTPPFVDPALTEEGLTHCRKIAERYGMLDDPAWLERPLVAGLPVDDRARLRQDVGDVLVLWAQALIRRAKENKGPDRAGPGRCRQATWPRGVVFFGPGATPRALMRTRADLVPLTGGDAEEERQLRSRARAIPLRANSDSSCSKIPTRSLPTSASDSPPNRTRSPARPPELGGVGRPRKLERPAPQANGRASRLQRGRRAGTSVMGTRITIEGCFTSTEGQFSALEDFDRVVDLRPDMAAGLPPQGAREARDGRREGSGRRSDNLPRFEGRTTQSLVHPGGGEASARRPRRAPTDREQGLKLEPDEPAGFVARGLARLPGDVPGALADFDAALAIEPNNRFALQNKAHVLGELLGRGEEALKVLDTLLTHHPDLVEPLCGRGVQLARYGRRDGALRDARNALALDNGALTDYQVACIHALLAKQDPAESRDALRFLSEALHKDGSWLSIARKDPDLASIRNLPAFESLLRGFEAIPRPGPKQH